MADDKERPWTTADGVRVDSDATVYAILSDVRDFTLFPVSVARVEAYGTAQEFVAERYSTPRAAILAAIAEERRVFEARVARLEKMLADA